MRGILIILTVTGHYWNNTNIQEIIYWFHMPCFVILSGWLHTNKKLTLRYLRRKISIYLIPYIIYATAIDLLYFKLSLSETAKMILFGSGKLQSGVLWYLPIFCISWLIGVVLVRITNENRKSLFVISLLFIFVASLLSNFTRIVLPWNLDVYVIMSGYFLIGKLLNLCLLKNENNVCGGREICLGYRVEYVLFS